MDYVLNPDDAALAVFLIGYGAAKGACSETHGVVSQESFCRLLTKLGVQRPEQYYDGKIEER